MIEHKAKVIDVQKNIIIAQITIKEACQSCEIRHKCGMSQSKKKNITIKTTQQNIKIGDNITILLSEKQAKFALFWAYVVPIFLMIMTLILCLKNNITENTSGIFSIICLIPYYFGLWFYHNFFAKKITFEIKKEDN